ncbi:hypothetical protein [Microbulbifer magnicolonia]|nr:hypothetical protein [Microbulbifer sp. GG15]
MLFSFEQRRIILFGSALSWHDLSLLAGLLIAGARKQEQQGPQAVHGA